MSKNLRVLLTAHLSVAIAGFGTGWLRSEPAPIEMRTPSSVQDPGASLTYSDTDMPCPNDSEYRRLAAIVNLVVPAGINACSDQYHSKLARLLAYTDKLKIEFAPDWAPALQEDLGNPLAYIGRMSRKMDLDLNEGTAIAYNKVSEKSIYLGALFFQEDPLEALSILMHEARHSSEHDPRHAPCRTGDIPKAQGGCDQELSMDPLKAGAYSYGAAFYAALGLYGEGLSSTDRMQLMNLSLATVGTRFNKLPEVLAQALDLLAVLDEKGSVFLLHPFSPQPTPLSLTFLAEGEKVHRIDLNVKNNGLLLFTSGNRLFSWDQAAGFKRIYAEIIPENFPILDAARMRVPFGDYPYYNFLTSKNQVFYYRFSPNTKSYELAPLPIFTQNSPIPELSRIFMGLHGRSLFLGKDGSFSIGPVFANEPAFHPRADLQIPGRRWIYGTGGVVFENLYGITDDGKVHYAKIDLLPPEVGSDYETEVYTLKPSSLQTANNRHARKVIEGLSLRVLLDTEGELTFENYGSERRTVWRKQENRVVDFAILRRHVANFSRLNSDLRDEFASNCRLHSVIEDPWFGIGMGLNASGELVIGDPGSRQTCLPAGPRKYQDIRLTHDTGRRNSQQREEHPALVGAEPPAHTSPLLWGKDSKGSAGPRMPYDFD